MIFQNFRHRELSYFEESRLNAALYKWKGGALDAFTSGFEEAHSQFTALGWIAQEVAEIEADDKTPIIKQDWNKEHPYWREDIPWTDDLTVGIAQVRNNRQKRLDELAWRRNNVDFWSLPNISGTLLGAMASPESLIPYTGMIGRAGQLVNSGVKAGVMRKYFKPIVLGMTDAAIADSLFQTVKATVQVNRGENPDLVHAMFEVGLATMTGGLIGTFPMAAQVASKVPKMMRPAILKKTMQDLSQGKPASFFKSPFRRNEGEELNPDQVAKDINERMNNIKDDAESLRTDASIEAGKDAIKKPVGWGRKAINKAANCIRLRKDKK